MHGRGHAAVADSGQTEIRIVAGYGDRKLELVNLAAENTDRHGNCAAQDSLLVVDLLLQILQLLDTSAIVLQPALGVFRRILAMVEIAYPSCENQVLSDLLRPTWLVHCTASN